MTDIAAVTGASRGIGRATALELARRGYRVFALARAEQDLQALTAQAPQIVPVVMDIADAASRARAVEAILAATDGYGVDVLVNNAGYGQSGPLEEISAERLRRQLEVNVVGLLAFTQPFLPGMREHRRGWVINISSAAGRVATPFMGAYNTSKFALEGMSDALRLELAPFGVHVVLIEPGPIRSNFGRVAAAEAVHSPDSAYAGFQSRFQGAHEDFQLFSRSPEAVAGVIARVAASRRPRPRYTITIPAKLATFGRLVPDVIRDWAFRWVIGLRKV